MYVDIFFFTINVVLQLLSIYYVIWHHIAVTEKLSVWREKSLVTRIIWNV